MMRFARESVYFEDQLNSRRDRWWSITTPEEGGDMMREPNLLRIHGHDWGPAGQRTRKVVG